MPPSRAASRAILIYPRTVHNGSYKSFLQLTIKQSKTSAILATTKAEIDAVFEATVRRQYPHDDSKCDRLIAESATKASTKLWESVTSLKARSIPASERPSTTSQLDRNIKLAAVPHDHRGQYEDTIELQRYEDFARKTKKLNPEVTFSKDLMDDAFRVAAARATSKKGRSYKDTAVEQMLVRCLGEESEKYWKD